MAPPFDPDGLYLTKPQIRQIIEAIKQRWKKNRKGNFIHIQALTAFSISLGLMSDEQVEAIFKDIIKATNKLAELNQMQRLKGEFPSTASMVDLVVKDIEGGNLF